MSCSDYKGADHSECSSKTYGLTCELCNNEVCIHFIADKLKEHALFNDTDLVDDTSLFTMAINVKNNCGSLCRDHFDHTKHFMVKCEHCFNYYYCQNCCLRNKATCGLANVTEVSCYYCSNDRFHNSTCYIVSSDISDESARDI